MAPDVASAFLTLPQRTGVTVLLSVSAAAMVAAPTGLAQRPAGWLLLGAAGLIGLNPLARHALGGRPAEALALGGLSSPTAALVRRAADEAAVLRGLAQRAPTGPVAEHLDHLATTAGGYVLALHQAATGPGSGGPGRAARSDAELEAAMARIVAQLADLSSAAARLVQAQRQHLLGSPLEDLTAATDALTAAIESGQLR